MATIEFVSVILNLHNEARGTSYTSDEFVKWMSGQTIVCVNGENLYLYNDVLRFLNGNRVID